MDGKQSCTAIYSHMGVVAMETNSHLPGKERLCGWEGRKETDGWETVNIHVYSHKDFRGSEGVD